MFPEIGVSQNGWFIMEIPIKMDDLGGKPTIFGNIHMLSLLLNTSNHSPKAKPCDIGGAKQPRNDAFFY